MRGKDKRTHCSFLAAIPFLPTMHVKPWSIMVLRIRLTDGGKKPEWTVLGTLPDINWDYSIGNVRKTPLVLGPESEDSFLVSADTFGLSLRTCADYKNSLELYNAQLEHDRIHGRPWTFDPKENVWIPPPREAIAAAEARMEQLKATIAETGAAIQAAITEHFPRWHKAQTAPPPPWSSALTAADPDDLYV